jgi:hypothetical protein
MAVSGSTDFSIDRDGLIEAALRSCGVLDPESGSASAGQLTTGAEALNLIVKAWSSKHGMPLWALKSATITLVADTATYSMSTIGIDRPDRIIQAYRTDTTSTTDTPMEVITRDEYIQLGNKASNGAPILLWWDPQIAVADSDVNLYPTPSTTDASNYTVTFWYHRPFYDFDAATDTPDFPQKWYQAIRWALAEDLAHEYGVPGPRLDRIERKAEKEFNNVVDNEQEEGSIYIVPDPRMARG